MVCVYVLVGEEGYGGKANFQVAAADPSSDSPKIRFKIMANRTPPWAIRFITIGILELK